MKEDYEEAELVRVVPRLLKPEEEFEMVTFLKIAELSEPNGSNVVFSHVESPGDFSVYEVNDKVLQVDNLREEMQNFYAGGQRLPKPCLKEGLFIVAFFPDDGFWYRAQILTKKGSEYQVLYVDYGNQATVNEPQIKPLFRQFAVLPALTIRCKLAEIAPISGDEWTEPVKLFFQEVAPAMNHVFVRVIDRDLDGILSVIAVDESRGDGLSYNKLLVQEGYAAYLYDTNGQLEGPGKEMKQEDELNWKDFDPMKEDFESRRNAYDYDVDDAGIAITGHKAQDEATVCKFFRSNKPCPRRDLCPFRHILLPEDGMTTDQKEIYNNIPKPEIPCDDTLLMVQVTAMYHPSHFYVNFPRGIGNLRSNDLNLNGLMDAGSSLVEEFSRELHEHYDKRRFMSSIHEVPALSEIIVACSPGDKRWYRARVIGYGDDQEGMVKVFYLDMGFMEMVPEKDLRILDPKFASTPALALECRLFGVLPSVGFKWSSVAKSYFMSLISSTLDTFPILAWIEGWFRSFLEMVQIMGKPKEFVNLGASAFFEYGTSKIVHIRSKRVGILNRFVQLCIIAYIVGYVMVYNRGYQDRGDVESAVTTKVKGVAYSNFSDDQLHVPDAYKPMYRRIWDVADQVIPASENNAFFVATNVIITPNQTIGLCPEDPAVPGAICDDDPYSCPIGEPFLLGNGVRTGRCSNETEGNPRTCEIHAWCPVEVNNMPLDGLALLEGVQNYTVLLKNFIAFPKFGEEYRRRNILDSYTKEQLNSCHFDPKNDSYCPIFTLGTIIQEAGISNFTDIAISGGVVAIEISWDCNLDRDFKSHCLPKYEFRRLDDPNAKVAPGWNFRYAQYYRDDVRTLFKVFGIKFVVNVYGEARKFSIIPTLLNIGSGLALLGLAEVVCDLVVLYIFSKGPVYREAKYQVVHGEDAYKVSEGEEEEEVGRRDNRSYRTFRDS